MRRMLLVATVSALGALAVVPQADALTRAPVWECRASATYVSVTGQNRVEPVVANGNINTANGADPDHAQCVSGEAGAGNTPTQLGINPNALNASTASAVTQITPELGSSSAQTATSIARVENLALQLPTGGTTILGVNVAESKVVGSCVGGQPNIQGNASGVTVTLGGTGIPLDGLLNALNAILPDSLITIKPNEKTVENNNTFVVRGLHITIAPRSGNSPVIDVVVGETKVGFNGNVCGPDDNGGGGQVCPAGSTLDPERVLCVIPGSSGSSYGEIIVGRPFQGPSGGTVIPLDLAKKKYPKAPCVQGGGAPRFVILGTNKNDRITGSNKADRILGLGGKDQISGGRGNDCMEGGSGSDNMSGSLGNDRAYGQAGGDHLNGGPGSDTLSGGAGNDTINAAFGRDKVTGGSGRDFINIATAGPSASANCGSGRDKVRLNNNEKRRLKGCETKYIFRDR